MDLTTYERLIKTVNAARKYLLLLMRYTFQDFSGRWINRGNLTAGQLLRHIKLFELELSVRNIAQQLRLIYNTAYRAVHMIRAAILAHGIDGDVFLGGDVAADESYFGGRRKGKRGRGAAGKVPVFRAKDMLALTVKKVRRGSIVYTDRYKVYDVLMFRGFRHLRVDHGRYFSHSRVYFNGLEGFWCYAKERIIKHHVVSPQRFPYSLKELEFRYNHRKEDLFPWITK